MRRVQVHKQTRDREGTKNRESDPPPPQPHPPNNDKKQRSICTRTPFSPRPTRAASRGAKRSDVQHVPLLWREQEADKFPDCRPFPPITAALRQQEVLSPTATLRESAGRHSGGHGFTRKDMKSTHAHTHTDTKTQYTCMGLDLDKDTRGVQMKMSRL